MDDSSGVLVLVLSAGQDRVGQVYIQLVVVLDQGDVLVVEHQVLERRVQVVRLGESVTRDCLVDDAVLGVAVHTTEKDRAERWTCTVLTTYAAVAGFESFVLVYSNIFSL